MALSRNDQRRLLEMLHIVYTITDRTAMFTALCAALDHVVPVSSAVYLPVDGETGNFTFPGPIAFRCNGKLGFVFAAYYAPLNPLSQSGLPRTHPNEPISLTDVIPASRILDTEYGYDFQRKVPSFYQLVTWLVAHGEPLGGIGLHRRKGDRDFSRREKDLVGALMPHVARALRTLDVLETATSDRGVGMIILGPDGTPLYVNDEATRLLDGRPVSGIPQPGLGVDPAFFRSPHGTYRVRRIRRGHGETVVLLEPCAAAGSSPCQLDRFDLTTRQVEIARLVAQRFSNREIAECLGIAEQTVKDHLRGIFARLGVRSRGELRRTLMDAPTPSA